MDTAELPHLIAYLDARLDAIGGYALSIRHYDFRPGNHITRVQMFPGAVERAQVVTDTLGIEFHHDDTAPEHYTARKDSVEYTFHIPPVDGTPNPPTFMPTKLHA